MTEQETLFYDKKALKSRCVRVGALVSVFFISNYAALFALIGAMNLFDLNDRLGGDAWYILTMSVSILFGYILPFVIGMVILGIDKAALRAKYYGAEYGIGKGVLLIPAAYALMVLSSWVNQFIFYVISRLTGFEGLVNPIAENTPETFPSAVMFVFTAVVAAPVFEELVFRGIILSNLRRFGDKFAIVASAILFGISHGNFSQFLYAVALGLIFGYIAVRANSAKPTIVMHAVVNSFGMMATFMSKNEFISGLEEKAMDIAQITGQQVSLLLITGLFGLIIAAVFLTGFVSLIVITVRYVRARTRGFGISHLSEGAPGLSEPKKYAAFFTRWSVILAIILAAFEFVQSLLPGLSDRIVDGIQNLF